jgi:DinB superfamily
MAVETHPALARLFSELVDGARPGGDAFILNSGDAGLLKSLDKLSADDASRSSNGGATIAAHAQHLRYGLGLMNRWATEGGNPFADAKWDEAWKISAVSPVEWQEIREGLRAEAQRWLAVLQSGRRATDVELTGMIASIAHLAYHLGAIRQINKGARGPREGTF